MFVNCDFKHNLYIDGIQNGGYQIHRRRDGRDVDGIRNFESIWPSSE